MIYTLTVEFAASKEEWARVIEIDEGSSFDDLHLAIQRAVDFDNDHCYEFFGGRHERQRKETFFAADPSGKPLDEMQEMTLREVFPLPPGMKLFYLFDFGDEWRFRLKKARKIKEPEEGVVYPRVTEQVGPNPEQYPYCE